MFGLTFHQILALIPEAPEMTEMAQEMAAVYQRHEAMIRRVAVILAGGVKELDIPHEAAVVQVSKAVSEHIAPADLAIMRERSDAN